MTTPRRRAGRISDQWLQYVRSIVTESAAATFTEVTVNLPVVVAQGFVIEAHSIELDIDALTFADLKATDDTLIYAAQVTKASQTAMLSLDNPSLIYAHSIEYASIDIQTAEKSPVLIHERIGQKEWQFADPILLPFEQIFFAMQTSGGSVVKSTRMRIGYKTLQLTTRQLPELLQAVT